MCTRRPVFPLLGVVSPPADTQPPRRPCVLGSGDTPTPLAGTERSPGAPAPPNSRDEVTGAVAASTCARSGGAARAVAVRLLAVGLAPGEVSGAPPPEAEVPGGQELTHALPRASVSGDSGSGSRLTGPLPQGPADPGCWAALLASPRSEEDSEEDGPAQREAWNGPALPPCGRGLGRRVRDQEPPGEADHEESGEMEGPPGSGRAGPGG